MNYGYILTINNIPIRSIPLRFKKYNKKWVADGNLNNIVIFKNEIYAKNALDWIQRKDNVYCNEQYEFDTSKVKISKVKLIIEESDK